MAYQALPAKAAGDTFTVNEYDKIKGNFEASGIDIVTTKGDLVVATTADTLARLAVGNDDDVLVPDSGETTGLAWQIQPACRVYNSSAIDPTTSTWVSLTFDSERFDLNDMHSVSSNTDRITVPSDGGGLYIVGACAELSTGAVAGECGLRILLNGSTVIARQYYDVDSGVSNGIGLCVSTLYSLSATDYIVAQIYTAGNLNVVASGNSSPEFWAIWQRRQ